MDIQYKEIKYFAVESLCYDNFAKEKTMYIAPDKIIYKTEIQEFEMPLSGPRTGKKYFCLVLINNTCIFCKASEFDKI